MNSSRTGIAAVLLFALPLAEVGCGHRAMYRAARARARC